MLKRASVTLGLLGAFPAAAVAHPGHGDGVVHGLGHFLASPDHALGIILVLFAVVWAAASWIRREVNFRR